MASAQWASKQFLHLKESGFDIDTCHVDFASISIRCEDFSRYRKAFRVKIRASIKKEDSDTLRRCIDAFYRLAQFVRHLYGHHSCDGSVEPWQEQVAEVLQKKSAMEFSGFEKGSRLIYEEPAFYQRHLRSEYLRSLSSDTTGILRCIQDGRAFLNPKDQAHFERWYESEHLLPKG